MASEKQRKIIHVDCDCFYAAVEVRDNPSLDGLPVAVGGSPGKRGVIATCNYEARKFGVHSAMSSARAQRLCPDLRFISPNMKKYQVVSQEIHKIFQKYTHLIEPLSLDEAFLDVSESDDFKGSATLIAKQIKQEVHHNLGITVSAGVAPNKFLAKIASDWEKPDGLFVIKPQDIEGFVANLPVDKLFGVGKVTAKKMADLGIHTCTDLRAYTVLQLTEKFGVFGKRLHELARGIDNRPVRTSRERKSISVEKTFEFDLLTKEQLSLEIESLWLRLSERIDKKGSNREIKSIFMKVKYADFIQNSIERGVKGDLSEQAFIPLLHEALVKRNHAVRLLGIGVRFRSESQIQKQLTLWE